ncbi:MAG: hypothetical protein LC793_13625, partial [Thermomicrobia bacterium]|nr:hypothetical protein [Thermomicrobia bacterium]MCA1722713.1 hypothetical protein [Thermomicrobia bacterium]
MLIANVPSARPEMPRIVEQREVIAVMGDDDPSAIRRIEQLARPHARFLLLPSLPLHFPRFYTAEAKEMTDTHPHGFALPGHKARHSVPVVY